MCVCVRDVQAQSKEIHSMWTCELRRLLQDQLKLIKGGPGVVGVVYWTVVGNSVVLGTSLHVYDRLVGGCGSR